MSAAAKSYCATYFTYVLFIFGRAAKFLSRLKGLVFIAVECSHHNIRLNVCTSMSTP